MKRCRSQNDACDQQDHRVQRSCIRELCASPAVETTFFFVRLPDGHTATIEFDLHATIEQLVSQLTRQHGLTRHDGKHTAQERFYLVIGKHTAQPDETLAAAGVSRDCTVRLQLRMVQTATEIFNQQHASVKSLMQHFLQGHVTYADQQAMLQDVLTWIQTVRTAVIEGEYPDLAATLHVAIQCCFSVAHHKDATLDDIAFAIKCLKTAANMASTQFVPAVEEQQTDGSAPNYMAQLILQTARAAEPCSAILQWLETWLTAVAAQLEITLYHQTLLTSGTLATSHLAQSLQALPDVLDPLVTWLQRPIPAELVPLPQHQFAKKRLCESVASGQAILVCLMKCVDGRRFITAAALLQCITLMMAEHALSSCQLVLRALPGLDNDLSKINLTSPLSVSTPDKWVAAPGPTSSDTFHKYLAPLAHASLLVEPITSKHMQANSAVDAAVEDDTLECHVLSVAGQGPGVVVVNAVLKAVTASALLRREAESRMSDTGLVRGSASALDLELNKNLVFGGERQLTWDILPLLTEALEVIRGFTVFMQGQGAMSGPAGLPEFLKTEEALLHISQAWLTLQELAGQPQQGIEDVSKLLGCSLVSGWIQSQITQLTPSSTEDHSHYRVVQALMELVTWAPKLLSALPSSFRSHWLNKMLFPSELQDDDEVSDVEFDVRRDQLIEDSYSELLSLEPSALRARMVVRFTGEDAMGDGVLKEYLVQLARLLFDPFAALFQPGATDMSVLHPSASAVVQPDWRKYFRLAGRVVGLALRHRVPLGIQLSSAFFKTLQSIQATGSVDNPATYASQHAYLAYSWMLPTALTHPNKQSTSDADSLSIEADEARRRVFTTTAGHWIMRPTLEDVKQIDPEMYKSLKYLLDNANAADDIHLTWTAASASAAHADFAAQHGADECKSDSKAAAPAAAAAGGDGAGSSGNGVAAAATSSTGGGEVELVPGGANRAVTEENKAAYVQALVDYKLSGSCREQALWFYVGLCDVAHPKSLTLSRGHLLLPLTSSDFNSMLQGSAAALTVRDWKAATSVGSSLSGESGQKTVKMFWQVIESLTNDQRRQLLRFWTGITHLPASGFRGLGRKLQIMGLNPPEDSETEAADEAAGIDVNQEFDNHDGDGGLGQQQQQQQQQAAVLPTGVAASASAAGGAVPGAGSAGTSAGSSSSSSAALNAVAPGGDQDGQPVVLQLPRAHICFMQLLLPMGYKDVNEMRRSVLVALQNVDYFGQT